MNKALVHPIVILSVLSVLCLSGFQIDNNRYSSSISNEIKAYNPSAPIKPSAPLVVSNDQSKPETDEEWVKLFYTLVVNDNRLHDKTLAFIRSNWENSFYAPLIDILIISRNTSLNKKIYNLLEYKSRAKIKTNPFDWLEWLWMKKKPYPSFYADFKAELYRIIDPNFYTYFKNRKEKTAIRFDEILWGGVDQDGIPPLRLPNLIDADEAKYLYGGDIIFGINLNGIQKAYPKRILGWHEMVVDNFGTTEIAGVYCTLCGTMIAYDTNVDGKKFNLGTSGFLYRSNKLMYDKETQSLWNTIEGKPVVGPLVGLNLELTSYPVVTTTWKEWRKQYPNTKVLSLKTGYQRDYRSGVAYRKYYSTDDLMFPVPLEDKILKNKEEVLVIRSKHYREDPIAISIEFLKKNKIYHDVINKNNFVVITSAGGGARVFESRDYIFESFNNSQLIDSNNGVWTVGPNYIKNEKGVVLKQLPSHNIFWFAWYNAFPETRLVK